MAKKREVDYERQGQRKGWKKRKKGNGWGEGEVGEEKRGRKMKKCK